MKNIVILGSTGSIGTQTLDIVRALPEKLHVSALAAGGSRPELLAEQVLEFLPEMVVVYEPEQMEAVKALLKGKAPEGLQYRCGRIDRSSCAARGGACCDFTGRHDRNSANGSSDSGRKSYCAGQ